MIPVQFRVFNSPAPRVRFCDVPFQIQKSPSKTTFTVQFPSTFPIFLNVIFTAKSSPRAFATTPLPSVEHTTGSEALINEKFATTTMRASERNRKPNLLSNLYTHFQR